MARQAGRGVLPGGAGPRRAHAPRGCCCWACRGAARASPRGSRPASWGSRWCAWTWRALLASDLGRSEANLRKALASVAAVAPAVLWLDELEKAFAGATGGANGEGGGGGADSNAAVRRMVGSLLTWMEDRPAPVFVTATANAVDALPPELLRRGRFDELFFIDLPNEYERRNILEVHLRQRRLDPRGLRRERVGGPRRGPQRGGAGGGGDHGADRGPHRRPGTRLRGLQEGRGGDGAAVDDDGGPDLRPPRVGPPPLPAGHAGQPRAGDARTGRSGSGRIRRNRSPATPGRDWPRRGRCGRRSRSTWGRRTGPRSPGCWPALAPHTPTAGPLALALKRRRNAVVWTGLDEGFAAELKQLVDNRRVYLHPAPADDHPEPSAEHGRPDLPVHDGAGDPPDRPPLAAGRTENDPPPRRRPGPRPTGPRAAGEAGERPRVPARCASAGGEAVRPSRDRLEPRPSGSVSPRVAAAGDAS